MSAFIHFCGLESTDKPMILTAEVSIREPNILVGFLLSYTGHTMKRR